MKKKDRARAVCRRIRYQFPKTPEGQLMFSIVAMAIVDSTGKSLRGKRKRSAVDYLQGDIYHAELAGVDSGWIRLIMKKAGVGLDGDITNG